MTTDDWLLTLGFKDPKQLSTAQYYNLELAFLAREPESFEEFLGAWGFEDGSGLTDVQRVNLKILAQETYGIGDDAAAVERDDEEEDDIVDLGEDLSEEAPPENG